MPLVLGIDSGGTFTDGVLLDPETKEVKKKAKAFTTREDLSIGIRNCMENMNDFGSTNDEVFLETRLEVTAVGQPGLEE